MAEGRDEPGDKFFTNRRVETPVKGKPYATYCYNDVNWFSWTEGEERACLDGNFTPEELIAIARGMLLRKGAPSGK